jgi:hypothetical protein
MIPAIFEIISIINKKVSTSFVLRTLISYIFNGDEKY